MDGILESFSYGQLGFRILTAAIKVVLSPVSIANVVIAAGWIQFTQ